MEMTHLAGLACPPGSGPERALQNRESEGPDPGGRGPGGPSGGLAPDPEVLEKPVRRRHTVEYKLHILAEAEACEQVRGQLGALLRREGLYASQLKTWRAQREQGVLAALAPRKRGRKPQAPSPLVQENRRLERENARLAARLKQAEAIIDLQKKVSDLLGISLNHPEPGEPA